ncbi:MAG: DUF5662 family protein [Cetobacterium sp.]
MKTDYIGYLKYVLEHKKNVFKTCWKRGLYMHAFTHDLSKFLPSEFIPYAKWFYGEYGIKFNGGMSWEFDLHNKCHREFDIAWVKHYKRNKHHWNHYYNTLFKKSRHMQREYIMQMICDWEAMALKFGDTSQEFYLNNYNKIELTDNSRLILEIELGLNDSGFHNYGHTLKQFKEMYNERKYNDYFGWIKDKYGIDTYNEI